MNVIESLNNTTTKATDVGERYLKTSHEYYKLKIFQQLVTSISIVFKAVAVGGLILFGIGLLAIALAMFIGNYIDNQYLGFAIVGMLFIALSLMTYYLRKYIDNAVVKTLSKKFFS